jgi:esterase/lipase
MTTSVLMSHTRGLTDFDLQVVRDYALEAPWAWRLALEELVECAEQSDKVEDEAQEARAKEQETQEAHKELQAAVKAAMKQMLQHVEKLEKGGNLTKGEIDSITKGIRQAFDELEDHAE